MDTSVSEPASALFGKTRRRVLGLLYSRPEQRFYLREIARQTDAPLGAVQRELGRLAAVGIIERRVHGRQVFFQANADCPIYRELKGLVTKTTGIADVMRSALAPLAGRIRVAFIHGSFARGEQTSESDVDLLIVGDASFVEVVSVLRSAQDKVGREVNPSLYPVAEYVRKLAAGQHFLRTLLAEPRIFLIGDERELARMAKQRLAGPAQDNQAGDQGPARRRRPRPGRLSGKRT